MGDVRAAIEMVARGGASRVTVSGLAYGEQLLRECESLASQRGVILTPLWWAEDAGCDIQVSAPEAPAADDRAGGSRG
jgi:hypothetical protein